MHIPVILLDQQGQTSHTYTGLMFSIDCKGNIHQLFSTRTVFSKDFESTFLLFTTVFFHTTDFKFAAD